MISKSTEINRYCSEPVENIENYAQAVADKEHIWDCHHRLEVQGGFTNSVKLLKKCDMYWNQPAERLIFLRRDEHLRLHIRLRNKGNEYSKGKKNRLGHHHSDETRRKISEARTGKNHPNFGKHLSEETRRKISEALRKKKG